MLGKVVQIWRIRASRFERQNTKWKACDGFQKLVQLWRRCIEVRGDFVEK
jgi:hypothetical protein